MLQPQEIEEEKPYPNNVRACIKRQGYTIQEVADEIGIPRRTLTNYLSGRVPTPRRVLEKIAYTIGCDIEEFALQSVQHDHTTSLVGGQQEDHSILSQTLGTREMTGRFDQSRRTFLHQLFGATGTALLTNSQELLNPPLWERLSLVLSKPSSMDIATLGHLETITRHYWELCGNISSRQLLSGVLGHLQTLTDLLGGSYLTTIHQHLCSIAGQTARLAGQLSFDLSTYQTAQAYYNVAIEAAQESTNQAFCAFSLGCMSFLPTYGDRPELAIVLLEEARRLAVESATPSTRSWLAAVEAEAQAKTSNRTACLKALEQAELMLDQPASEENPYWMSFDRAALAGYKGACYIHLELPEQAQLILKDSLASLDSSSLHQRSIILTDLATTYIQQEEIEKACDLAGEALELVAQTKSAMTLERLHAFRKRIEPWKDAPTVKNLDKQLPIL